MLSVRSRAFHGGFASIPSCRRCWSSTSISSTSTGGSFGEPNHVAVCCKGVVPSGGAGAMLRIHSGAALKGELCGVGLHVTDSGTALTGGPSIFISVSPSKATLASFCLKREKKVCGSPNSQSDSDTTTSQTTSTSEIRSIHNRNMRRHAPTHHTPMFTLVPRQIHHFLLPIHTRVGVTASAFTNHRHPFLFLPQTPSSHFYSLNLGFSCSCSPSLPLCLPHSHLTAAWLLVQCPPLVVIWAR